MFAVGIAFVCFCHDDRVLSAMAKFLVHLLGQGKERGEMGEGTGRRRECGENGKDLEVRKMEIHE